MKLFSFDEKEFEANLTKLKARRERKISSPRTYRTIKIKKGEKDKLIKEYNKPKEQFFILPNGLHVKEIFISGLGKGIVKLNVSKVIADIQACDKVFANIGKKKRR